MAKPAALPVSSEAELYQTERQSLRKPASFRGGRVSALAGDWIEYTVEDAGATQDVAYYNQKTGVTQWDRPAGWVKLMGQRFGHKKKASV